MQTHCRYITHTVDTNITHCRYITHTADLYTNITHCRYQHTADTNNSCCPLCRISTVPCTPSLAVQCSSHCSSTAVSDLLRMCNLQFSPRCSDCGAIITANSLSHLRDQTEPLQWSADTWPRGGGHQTRAIIHLDYFVSRNYYKVRASVILKFVV